MNQDNIENLLKIELRGESSPPVSLDLATKRKMAEAVEKKTYRFNIILLILSLLTILAGMVVLFPLIESELLKTVFIMMNLSILTFLALFFVINLKLKKRKGVLS